MTKSELIRLTGSGLAADYALEAVLGQVTEDFVQSAITAELDRLNAEIKDLEAEGYVFTIGGSYEVDWSKLQRPHDQHPTDEDVAAYVNSRDSCWQADMLVYRHKELASARARMTPSKESRQMYHVEWDDHEGNRHETDFETLEDAEAEADALRTKYDYVGIRSERR